MQKITTQNITDLVVPSILSGTITVLATIGLITMPVVASYGHDSFFFKSLFAARDLSSPTYHQVTDKLAQNALVSNAPLLLFWAAVGLMVYLIALKIISAFGQGANVLKQLDYVNAQPSKIIQNEVVKFVVRAAVLGLWLLYLRLFTRLLIPYALATAYAARIDGLATDIALVALASIIVLVSVHLHVVFLRLFVLKTRVFGS